MTIPLDFRIYISNASWLAPRTIPLPVVDSAKALSVAALCYAASKCDTTAKRPSFVRVNGNTFGTLNEDSNLPWCLEVGENQTSRVVYRDWWTRT